MKLQMDYSLHETNNDLRITCVMFCENHFYGDNSILKKATYMFNENMERPLGLMQPAVWALFPTFVCVKFIYKEMSLVFQNALWD